MINKKNHYLRTDGNGGLVVSKSIAYLTLISLLIALITSVVSAATYSVTNRERISNLEDNVIECEDDVDYNHKVIEEINSNVAVISTQINNIDKNIEDIKGRINK